MTLLDIIAAWLVIISVILLIVLTGCLEVQSITGTYNNGNNIITLNDDHTYTMKLAKSEYFIEGTWKYKGSSKLILRNRWGMTETMILEKDVLVDEATERWVKE